MISIADFESSKDTQEIIDAVLIIAAQYRQFVIGLGLSPDEIDAIERKIKSAATPMDKLTDVIRAYFRQSSTTTWETFIDAAKPINPALAKSKCIKKTYRDELGIEFSIPQEQNHAADCSLNLNGGILLNF